MEEEIRDISDPVCIAGDFNCIVKRQGGSPVLSADSAYFSDWINRLNLVDMGFMGTKFTCRRGKEVQFRVAKRLGHILINIRFGRRPLFVIFPNSRQITTPSFFAWRAIPGWIDHPYFGEFIDISWDRQADTCAAFDKLRGNLLQWNREVFDNIHIRKAKVVAHLDVVQRQLDSRVTSQLLSHEIALQEELKNIMSQEETLWFQKSRDNWIVLGVHNTSYFHASTIIRRQRNRILALRGQEGSWIVDPNELESHAVDFFKRLYTFPEVEAPDISFPKGGFLPIPPITSSHSMPRWMTVKSMQP
ncbi:LOW QUALITY PROTEIN: hypothetical protein V2J09_022615 [Rumex salicifolius]